MSIHTIILTPGPTTVEFAAACDQKKLFIFDKDVTKETASDDAFNGSKFFGTVCQMVSEGKTVAITDAADNLTKKGDLMLQHNLTSRVPGTSKANYSFILVTDDNVEKANKKSKEGQLYEWAKKNAKVMTIEEFTKTEFPTNVSVDKPYDVKVTCGLLTSHMQDGAVTGHMTKGFGFTIPDAELAQENNHDHVGKTYKGEIIKLTVNDGKSGDKDGGSIIMVPDVGPISHITNNTEIKSALSGPVLEKYNNKVMEFDLVEIDPTTKRNLKLKVEKVGETDVTVTGWYSYAIEQFRK